MTNLQITDAKGLKYLLSIGYWRLYRSVRIIRLLHVVGVTDWTGDTRGQDNLQMHKSLPVMHNKRPKGHITCTWEQVPPFWRSFLFTDSLCQFIHRSVGHDWCKLTRTYKSFLICDDKITENDRCVIKIFGIHCTDRPEKHKLAGGCWDLASCQVSLNSVKRFQKRNWKCLSEIKGKGGHLVSAISPKNTNLVEDIEILLPVCVKFCWILFSGFGEV